MWILEFKYLIVAVVAIVAVLVIVIFLSRSKKETKGKSSSKAKIKIGHEEEKEIGGIKKVTRREEETFKGKIKGVDMEGMHEDYYDVDYLGSGGKKK